MACYDLVGGVPMRRYVELLEPVGDTLVGAIALDPEGRLYVGVNSSTDGRTFGTTTLAARSVLVRIERDGTISAALPLSAPPTDEPTQIAPSGTTLYVSSGAAGATDAVVSRFETSSFSRLTSLRTHTGLELGVAVGASGAIVGGYFNPGPTDMGTVSRVDLALGATLWTRESVGSAYVQAVATNDTGEAFVGVRARYGDFQWAGTSEISPGLDTSDAGDIVLTRFDGSGGIVWLSRVIESSGEDVVGALDQADGSLVLVGYSPDLLAPSGLTELAPRSSGREGWVLRADPESGAALAWDQITASTDCVVQRMWRSGEWVYVTGLFRGTVRAAVSPAFGSGLVSTGMQDAFVVRMRVP